MRRIPQVSRCQCGDSSAPQFAFWLENPKLISSLSEVFKYLYCNGSTVKRITLHGLGQKAHKKIGPNLIGCMHDDELLFSCVYSWGRSSRAEEQSIRRSN